MSSATRTCCPSYATPQAFRLGPLFKSCAVLCVALHCDCLELGRHQEHHPPPPLRLCCSDSLLGEVTGGSAGSIVDTWLLLLHPPLLSSPLSGIASTPAQPLGKAPPLPLSRPHHTGTTHVQHAYACLAESVMGVQVRSNKAGQACPNTAAEAACEGH